MSALPNLELFEVPLHGVSLIEASAGTGKTYAIVALYLRLLLEEQRDVSEILAVTFTEAATQELRGRLHQALLAAQAALEGDSVEQDAFMGELLTRLPDHPGALERVHDAIIRLDEAAVYTIHGFCHRVLRDHAFECGVDLHSSLVKDEVALQHALIEDFWRRRIQHAPVEEFGWMHHCWSDPEQLLKEVQELSRFSGLYLLGVPTADELAARAEQVQGLHTQLGDAWAAHRPELLEVLENDPYLGRAEKTYRADKLEAAFSALDALCAAPIPAAILPANITLFTSEYLQASVKPAAKKKGKGPPEHPFFNLCGRYVQANNVWLQSRRAGLLAEAVEWFLVEGQHRRKQAQEWNFADLLAEVQRAVTGPAGERISALLRVRFPVALIDEFQDTDPLQWDIFHTLWAEAPDTSLFLVGDPKQAIYGFRGGDVFTYFRARRMVAAQAASFGMTTNWRASSALVTTLNRLFGETANPFLHEEGIQYHPVAAAGKTDERPLRLAGVEPAPVQFWLLERNEGQKIIFKGEASERFAMACAAEISRLLNLALQGEAMIGDEALRPADIAVLVRTNDDAALLCRHLAAAGVASVHKGRVSVYQTSEAEDLHWLLAALAEPGDSRRIAAALGTALMGVDGEELLAFHEDPGVRVRWVQRFQGYHQHWCQRGFIPMFYRLLWELGIPRRFLQRDDGERSLTNLLHLTELLQQAEQAQAGPETLLRWYQQARANPDGDQDEQQLRLESDAKRVQVLTVHRSKGLQYPVVFLPFLWVGRDGEKGSTVLFHDDEGIHCADLGSAERPGHIKLKGHEARAEAVRLSYVALTRAAHLCYIGWGKIRDVEQSALAALLHPPDSGGAEANAIGALDEAEIRADIERRLGAGVQVSSPPEACAPLADAAVDDSDLQARTFTGAVGSGWRVVSYSSLATGQEAREAGVESARPEAGQAADPRALPKGAEAGNMLHALLENMDFPAARGSALRTAILSGLQRDGFDPDCVDAVAVLVTGLLDTALDAAATLRLRDIGAGQKCAELGFWFPVLGLRAEALNALLQHYQVPGSHDYRFYEIAGMMKGYIDLVFEHQGRYYLADYKSNYLGDTPEAYDAQALAGAMAAHHYELQYLIYTVALHRHLATRISNYDYDTHFGGVYYLFLRGMAPACGPGSGIYFQRPERAFIEALDGLFAGEGA